jgi:hypothetical protein
MTHAQKAWPVGLLLVLSVATTSAFAQMPGMTEVSGTYVNEELGVEITFPDGWSGFEIAQTSDTTLVATSPGGMTESDVDTVLTLMMTDKSTRDTSDPSTYTQKQMECGEPSITSRSVAGVQGTQITVECPGDDQKVRIVAVETETNIVAVMFSAPISEFDANVGVFDNAVNSLSVEGATSTEGLPSTPPDTQTEEEPVAAMHSVMVGDEEIQVAVESESTISQFMLDEPNTTVQFRADGDGDSTTVAVGSVLEGPYVVMVDGEETTDFEESTNQDGVTTITVPHATGAHQVTITGTQVVPEFPVFVLGAIAATIGIVAVLTRTRPLNYR